LKGIVKVAAIDCDEEANKRTCGEYGVQGFPTIKIFKPSKKKGKPIVEGEMLQVTSCGRCGELTKVFNYADYMGERTAKAISDQITKRIPDHVKRLTNTTFEEFLANKNESAKAILFTNKAKPSPLWKSLAIDFIDVIQFAQVPNSEKAVAEKFGVEKFPTIVMLSGGEKEGVVYEGELNKPQLFHFFKEFQEPKKDPWAAVGTEEESTSSSSSTKTAATSSSSSSVAPKPTEKGRPSPTKIRIVTS
jgi:protein disulfide-isomerase A6